MAKLAKRQSRLQQMTFINIFIVFVFLFFFSEKIRLDVSSESSARQRIHMKKIKPSFLRKIKYKIKISSAAIFVRRFKG